MRNTFVNIGPRGCGRTTAIAEACGKIGATMVCANYEHARHVKNAFGVNTVSLNDTVGGTVGPYLFDHFTVDSLSVSYEQEINRLRTALAQTEALASRVIEERDHHREKQIQAERERDEARELLREAEQEFCSIGTPLAKAEAKRIRNYLRDTGE